MTIIPIKLNEETFKSTVCKCYHCGDSFGSANGICANFCKNCRTIEQKKVMDEENKTINPNFVCKFCVAMVDYKANEKTNSQ